MGALPVNLVIIIVLILVSKVLIVKKLKLVDFQEMILQVSNQIQKRNAFMHSELILLKIFIPS